MTEKRIFDKDVEYIKDMDLRRAALRGGCIQMKQYGGNSGMLDKKNFMKLQNGSDVRGVALAAPGEEVTLTSEAVNRIAGAFAALLAKRSGKKLQEMVIAVGMDSRVTAPIFLHETLQALEAAGVRALDCGLASTPAMFMSTILPETHADGSVMLTASHLPFNRNGMKFFTAEGGFEKSDITELLELAAETPARSVKEMPHHPCALIERYSRLLREKISSELGGEAKPLTGMHIVVDAGNGAGGFFATEVLAPLGADISGSLYLEPDGKFPNHVPNPEDAAAMEAIRGAVLQNKADLGLIFDTDVDRMSAVLPDGRELNRNALIAMMAALLAPDYPGSTIVTDSVTSDELTEFLEKELGLVHHRYMRGYKNVINECRRLNESGTVSPLAIETSGHGALKENYYLDDGAFLAVKLVIAAARLQREGRPLAKLVEKLAEPAETHEYRLYIRGVEDVRSYGVMVLDKFAERAKELGIKLAEPSYEGVRLILPQGWALLRMSLHDPNMPLNVEGRTKGSVAAISCQLRTLLRDLDCLDTTPLA